MVKGFLKIKLGLTTGKAQYFQNRRIKIKCRATFFRDTYAEL